MAIRGAKLITPIAPSILGEDPIKHFPTFSFCFYYWKIVGTNFFLKATAEIKTPVRWDNWSSRTCSLMSPTGGGAQFYSPMQFSPGNPLNFPIRQLCVFHWFLGGNLKGCMWPTKRGVRHWPPHPPCRVLLPQGSFSKRPVWPPCRIFLQAILYISS